MDKQQNFQLPEEEGIDIKKYLFLILSHWWWFAIALFISLTIAYLVNRYSKDVYSASCSIIIGEPESGSGSVESILDELSRFKGKRRKAVVENEVSILKSYSMARLALEDLDYGITYIAVGRRNIAEKQLYHTSPFVVISDNIEGLSYGTYYLTILSSNEFLIGSSEDNLVLHKFGETVEFGENKFKIVLRDSIKYNHDEQKSNKFYFRYEDINAQANAYSGALSVEVNAEKGSILTLRMLGFVPQQIADYLNKLCQVYIQSNLSEKNRASENTIQFIDEQLRGVVDSLESTGLRLQRFRSKNKVINLSQEGAFLFEKLQGLQSEKAALDIKERYYKYLLEYIENRKDFSDVVAPSVIGIADNLLNSLIAELNQLNLERRNLSLSIMEDSPQTNIINNKIINTQNALEENLTSLVRSNELALEELDVRIGKIEKEVQKLPGTERQLINIEREFTINDQIYTYLLEKRAEAGITKASNTSDHKVLDIARPKNAIKIEPKTSSNYMIALAVGVVVPLALLLMLEFFNSKLNDRKYIEKSLKPAIIGSIGHNDENSDLPTIENPRSSLSESFRELRTNLQYILKNKEDKIIAVTSAISGEGKTFTSINLAAILAMTGKKILLVSLDLRRPKVHKVFNLENKVGMSTYLIDKTSYKDIISKTNINNLFITASGPIPPNPAELLASNKMKDFVTKAKENFDYIVLDTPPIAIVTDTLVLKDIIDSFVFVIRYNYSDRQVIDLVNGIYNKKLVANLGVVINDIQYKGYSGYSYQYGYGYSYQYGNKYYSDDNKETLAKRIFGRIFNT